MPLSMTGYGRAREGRIMVEIRSVNHRGRDIVVKLPPGWHAFEPLIRALAAEIISRGRLDILVDLHAGPGKSTVRVNVDMARAYVKAARSLAKTFGISGGISVDQCMAWPGVVWVDKGEEQRVDWKILKRAMKKALQDLQAMRKREGVHLAEDLKRRLKRISLPLPFLEERSRANMAEHRERLKIRIAEWVGLPASVETARFEKEIAILVDKGDITEEIVRLKSHVDQMRDLSGGNQPMGRRMDFLIQEMLREVNTIGSKSNDSRMAHQVVEMKDALEQIREQVQNLE